MEFNPPRLDTLSLDELGSVREVLGGLVAYCDLRSLMLQANDTDAPVFQEKLTQLYESLPDWVRWKKTQGPMWEPFSQKCREAIVKAQAAAVRLQSNVIDTEHLLFGVLAAGTLLLKDPARVQRALEAQVVPGTQMPGDLVFTPYGKRAIEVAFAEARRVRATVIESDHLLIALAHAGGLATRVLAIQSLDHHTLRHALDTGTTC